MPCSRRSRIIAGGIACLAAPMLPSSLAIAKPATTAAATTDLSGFVDGVMSHAIATKEVAGGIVTVVANGRVIFSQGYGWADVDRHVPVSSERTLFHPGSVSKLFTWVALMQQVEAGRVSLDADVNTYLDFVIPAYQGQPVRVRDLLAHAEGMSDVSGVITYKPDEVMPYQQWLKTKLPPRVWAPGTEIAYSNWGAALAGYIVERVSGEAYPDYVERHIFRPLGMASTSFREPLPKPLQARLALGYKLEGGRFVAKPPELLGSVMPAGSSSATGTDMGRFMLALLAGGPPLLKPATLRLMEGDLLANDPDLPGMAHGFLVYRKAGPRLIGHAGNTIDFHSDLVLAPEQKIGFFVSVNGGAGSYQARTEISSALKGRLFPAMPSPRWTGADGTVTAGSYRANRRDYAKPADPEHDVSVAVAGPHRLTLKVEGVTSSWEQVGPRRYELVTGVPAGGPWEQISFSGPADAPKLQFSNEPYEAFHYVSAP